MKWKRVTKWISEVLQDLHDATNLNAYGSIFALEPQDKSNRYTTVSTHYDVKGRKIEVWACNCSYIVHASTRTTCGVRLIVPERGAILVMFDSQQHHYTGTYSAWLAEYAPPEGVWEAFNWFHVGEIQLFQLDLFEQTHRSVDLNKFERINDGPEVMGAATHLLGPQEWTAGLLDSSARSLIALRGEPLPVLVGLDQYLVLASDFRDMWDLHDTLTTAYRIKRDSVHLLKEHASTTPIADDVGTVNWATVFPDRNEVDWWGFRSWPVRAALIEVGAITDHSLLMEAVDYQHSRMNAALLNSSQVPQKIRVLAAL